MVKRSKKSNSKRISLRQKHKVLRKVKEHHRKKRKDAKKEGRSGQRKKVEKDPGIPNEWPFKEQELKALEARRAQALQELELKKEARKERVCHVLPAPASPSHLLLFLVLVCVRSNNISGAESTFHRIVFHCQFCCANNSLLARLCRALVRGQLPLDVSWILGS